MKRGKMYIAGPVFGLTQEDIRVRFARGVELARAENYRPVSAIEVHPAAHIGQCPPGRKGMEDHNEGCHLRADLMALLGCQAMLLLRGWQTSWGSKLELSVATAAGLYICFESNGELIWA